MQNHKNILTSDHRLLQPPKRKRKSVGQGMVEFALVLPALLLIVYGLLEVGRLLFIYGSTITAARQAARYGSATGLSDNGIPYYRDCNGIIAAVNNVAFINTFNNIYITYDRGLDSSGNVVSIPGINSSPTSNTCNSINDSTLRTGDRIKIQVSATWQPIVRIVPSWQGFTITSSAERTILRSVAIGVDPEAVSWAPGSSMLLSVSPSSSTYSTAGETITLTYTIQNNGNVTLTGPFTITDTISTVSCGGAPNSLLIGQTYSCTGTYKISAADVTNGSVSTAVSASATETISNTVPVTLTLAQTASLSLTKTASPAVAANAGTVITYTYTLKNTGTATLTSPYTITDNKIPSNQINCSSATSPLSPGASTTCTGSYTVTATDVSNGNVKNIATATAKYGNNNTVTSNSAEVTVPTAPLVLSISATLTTLDPPTNLQQKITYTYTLQNVGTTNLNAPYGITDSIATNIVCSSSSSLAPGATTTCTGEYTVTQADRDSGTGVVINSARASSNGGTILSNPASATVALPSSSTALKVTVTPSTSLATTLGAQVTYTYTVKNEGNVTINQSVVVTDYGLSGSPTPSCTLSGGALPPQATRTCTIVYAVKQLDLDAGSIINNAVAVTQNTTSAAATGIVITYNAPRITLTFSSNPTAFSGSGQNLFFTFKLRNTGNTNVTGPYLITLSSPSGVTVTCPTTPNPLPIGVEITCNANGNYTTTNTDVNAAKVTVQASASASSGNLTTTLNTSVPYSFSCVLYHNPAPVLTFAARTMTMNVISSINNSGTVNISTISLTGMNLNTHPQQRITSITYGGVTIWSGNSGQTSDIFFNSNSLFGDLTLPKGQNKYLVFNFNRDYTPLGNEKVVIKFTQSSCQDLDSSNSSQVP